MPDLHRGLAVHENLRQQLLDSFRELATDEETLADTLEGISPLPDMIAKVLRSARQGEVQAAALKDYINKLRDRHHRIAERAEKLKDLALQYALEGGVSRISAPDFSAYVQTKGKAGVKIPDDNMVPDEFCKISTSRVPDKGAIGDAIDNGGSFGWANRGNPKPFWLISEK